MTDSPAAIPVVRSSIIKEYADGDLAVRVIVPASEVGRFYEAFPEPGAAAFLGCDEGAIECIRDTLGGEYRDGSLSVRVLVAPKDKERFRQLWPKPDAPAVLAREAPARGREALMKAAVDEPPKFGPQAKALRLCLQFVGNPKVWAAVGSDEDFLSWLRTMPCAYCRGKPHWENDEYVHCVPAHVRRVAAGSGTAIKPVYSAIPLCNVCHDKQHRQGEGALGGKEWFDRQRIHHVVEWVWQSLKEQLGYEHWNEMPPATLHAWALEHGLLDALPPCYRPISEDNLEGFA